MLQTIVEPFFRVLSRAPTAFSKWQLLRTLIFLALMKRLRKNARGVKVKLGRYTINGPDYHVISSLLKEKFVNEEYHFQSGTTQPIIVDCGANIGISMLYFKFLYPDCEIHCFEPNDTAYNYLEKNVVENNVKSVFLYPNAGEHPAPSNSSRSLPSESEVPKKAKEFAKNRKPARNDRQTKKTTWRRPG